MKMPLPDVASLVDLDRYPIHDIDGERCTGLIENWKADLERTGACNLEGFLTPAGTRELAA